MWGASPDGAHPWLHAKPLDAATGRVPAPRTDYCSTNFISGSTRNAPKMPNESSMLETCTDEGYAIAEVRQRSGQA